MCIHGSDKMQNCWTLKPTVEKWYQRISRLSMKYPRDFVPEGFCHTFVMFSEQSARIIKHQHIHVKLLSKIWSTDIKPSKKALVSVNDRN